MLSILNYHILYDKNPTTEIQKDEIIYANEIQNFDQQIIYICDNNYKVLTFDSNADFKSTMNDLQRSVIITFDDGHISNYTHALPILQSYNFPAVFFITLKNVGSGIGMNWQQLREMADAGMSIQSHTMTHPFLSDLPAEQIKWELQESRTILEQELGRPVDYLSLPGGRYKAIVKEIAMEVGYKAVLTSIIGYNSPKTDPYSLRRWAIRRNMKLSTFKSIVEGKYSALAYHKTRYHLLNGFKKALGNERYNALREKFF
jgi:peptidoglycan/xylan/chitin deacetylase (PgdA/CDA1 family)